MTVLRRSLAPLALIGLFALTLPACAQSQETAPTEQRGARGPGGDPAERIDRQMASLDDALDLTSRQETQIRALYEEEAANRPARGARGERGAGGDRQAIREQMRARRQAFNAKVEALLTPDQVERFRAWQAEQRENRGRRGGRRGNG